MRALKPAVNLSMPAATLSVQLPKLVLQCLLSLSPPIHRASPWTLPVNRPHLQSPPAPLSAETGTHVLPWRAASAAAGERFTKYEQFICLVSPAYQLLIKNTAALISREKPLLSDSIFLRQCFTQFSFELFVDPTVLFNEMLV